MQGALIVAGCRHQQRQVKAVGGEGVALQRVRHRYSMCGVRAAGGHRGTMEVSPVDLRAPLSAAAADRCLQRPYGRRAVLAWPLPVATTDISRVRVAGRSGRYQAVLCSDTVGNCETMKLTRTARVFGRALRIRTAAEQQTEVLIICSNKLQHNRILKRCCGDCIKSGVVPGQLRNLSRVL